MHPKKLAGTKWTAVDPRGREKHFVVVAAVAPEHEGGPLVWVDLEAVYTGSVRRIEWRDLTDGAVWRQGWR